MSSHRAIRAILAASPTDRRCTAFRTADVEQGHPCELSPAKRRETRTTPVVSHGAVHRCPCSPQSTTVTRRQLERSRRLQASFSWLCIRYRQRPMCPHCRYNAEILETGLLNEKQSRTGAAQMQVRRQDIGPLPGLQWSGSDQLRPVYKHVPGWIQRAVRQSGSATQPSAAEAGAVGGPHRPQKGGRTRWWAPR
jgi:hypothetical protein